MASACWIVCSLTLFALRMASPQDQPPHPGERGLVPITRTVYAAPGGPYANMEFIHSSRCPLEAPHHDAVVRDLVARMGFYDFSLVKAAANAVLLTRGCLSDCRFDRGSTLGLFARQRLEDSSFSPPSVTCSWVSRDSQREIQRYYEDRVEKRRWKSLTRDIIKMRD